MSKASGFTTELEHELTELTDRGLVFVGRIKGATSTDTISVLPSVQGSEITYRADLDMHSVASLAAPAMKLVFEKLADETAERLMAVLNRR